MVKKKYKDFVELVDSLEKEFVSLSLSEIIPYEKNNRIHTSKDIDEIIKSITKDTYISPIIIDENNIIINGHWRKLALEKIWLKKVRVLRIYWMSEKQKKDARIRDNTTSFIAEFDIPNLRIELVELWDFSMDLIDTFDSDFWIDIWAEDMADKVYNEEIEDEIPDISEQIFVKPGDIFQLWDHYLMCGDSTSEKDVSKLLNWKRAQMVLTDPPYLMEYEGSIWGDWKKSWKKHKKIENDNLKWTAGLNFLSWFLGNVKKFCSWSFYIFFKESKIKYLLDAFEKVWLVWRKQIIWNKGHLNLSNSDYKSMYESVFYWFDDDYSPIYYWWNEDHNFYWKKNEVDILEYPLSSIINSQRTQFNDLHPTMKPIALLVKILNNSSLSKHIILDLFSWSGSTIIACEKTNRICYAMELSPEYCQVDIKRFNDVTGWSKKIKCLNREFDFSFL